MLLEGKTVIVSGVGAGLGREVAQAAYAQGANVVLGARTEANLAKAAGEFDAARVAYAATDITSEEACQGLVDVAVERFGTVDGLVNVAALDKAAIPHLARESGTSGIVHILSQSMWLPATEVQQSAYAASKGALLSATFGMAKELGSRRIRVNAVVPSWMWGPMVQGYAAWTAATQKVPEEQALAPIVARMALPEMATDGDVANAAVFMVSPYAGGITGQSLAVNAGDYMR
ncbi:MAG: short-chain dehydrogenase [Catenulispora sp. 13_1_20CM_3_70_7]|nr:MAG: short-chain dehydrogenase [Catenulispora sp. 13_1_20CM_3_70_7]